MSPLPPARTGIADYVAELLPFLTEMVEVTLFTDRPELADPRILARYRVHPIAAYPDQRWQFDLALYHMGNSSYHDAIYDMLLTYPGVVVLHDLCLHHFVAQRTLGRGDYAGYGREMGYAHGQVGLDWARLIRRGEQGPPYFDVNLNERLLDSSLGLVVHSHLAQNQVQRYRRTMPVLALPAPVGLSKATPHPRPPGWEDCVIFASAGQVTVAKRVREALEGMRILLERHPEVRFLVIGEWLEQEIDLPQVVHELGLDQYVHLTGHVPELQEMVNWMATADVVINLRAPSAGETSATALRALAIGRPLIVHDHAWYAELPDEACLKVPPGDQNALLAAMTRLAEDPELRQSLGRRAADYASDTHAPQRAAASCVAFCQSIVRGLAGQPAAR